MQEGGLDEAIRAAGSVGAQPTRLDLSPPVVPDRCASPSEYAAADGPEISREVEDVDLLRAHEYGLLTLLFGRAPSADLLDQLAALTGDASPLGLAHIQLAQAAALDPDAVSREFFDLFVGLGRGELLPYASYYLTGFLHERPLARVREDLARLGLERVEEQGEPEDHVAILCDVMAGLCAGRFEAGPGAERAFFDRHLKPWAARFFADCETSRHGRFYRAAGTVGRLFMEIEAQAFAMES